MEHGGKQEAQARRHVFAKSSADGREVHVPHLNHCTRVRGKHVRDAAHHKTVTGRERVHGRTLLESTTAEDDFLQKRDAFPSAEYNSSSCVRAGGQVGG